MSSKILVVGAGAIGGFYGALLARAGCEVSVVCRSDYALATQQGYKIESNIIGTWQFKPEHTLHHSADYHEKADYVILCSKVTACVDRVELIRPAVSPGTVIVLIQNGVDIEREVIDAFPDNELISGLAFVCCNRIAPAHIHHLAYGKLTLGNPGVEPSHATQALSELFRAAGIECAVSHDIVASRWQKCVWNAPFNPLSVLSGGLSTQNILFNQEPLVRHVMREICAIATAAGHSLPADVIDNNIEQTRSMPPYKTSMLLDFEQGQPLETEAILGNAYRIALRHDVPCPYLETLYRLMLLRESARPS